MEFLSVRVWKQVLYVVGLTLGLLVVSLPSFSQGNAGRITGAVRLWWFVWMLRS